jgi:hypothetical protein
MAGRQFTLEEAQEMLPRLAPLLWEMREKKQEHDAHVQELNAQQIAMRGNGHGMESAVADTQRKIGEAAGVINEIIERVHEMEVELKDVDMGLIDFRHVRNGREVYLCWKLGEENIEWWHPLDSGFASRQPLSGALDD